MPVVGRPRIGIAASLRDLDFIGERCRPFVPGEQAAS